MGRDEFSAQVKSHLALRVNHRCSNPGCRVTTSGPQNDPEASVNIGVAAHITAASVGGPRFNAALRKEERVAANNGIWLCQNCAKLVDNDEERYSEGLLREWKEAAEGEARREVGKQLRSSMAEGERSPVPTELQRTGPNEEERERVPFTVDDLSEFGGLKLQGYNVYQALALNSFSNDIDGWVLMLIDERLHGLTGGIVKDGYSQLMAPHFGFDPEAWRHPQGHLRQALLLVVDERGRILYSEQLGRESARLDRVYLYHDRSRPTFVVTRDYSMGMGSYNGPISYFLEVSGQGIHYILPHGLMTSLKTAWAVIDRRPTAEVLAKKCRPNFGGAGPSEIDFEVVYEHFYLEGGVWNMESHRERGFWEHLKALDPGEFWARFTDREHT